MGSWLICYRCNLYSHTHNGGGEINNKHYCESCYAEIKQE